MRNVQTIIAEIKAGEDKAPEWMLLFKEGWNDVEGKGPFLVDRAAYDVLKKNIAKRGNDIVFDYEHQTVKDVKAPASGWIKKVRYDDKAGIMAMVNWTNEAAEYIAKNEYRYFSPVFYVRKKDKRLIDLHSVALTNTPRINHLTPLLAKLGATLKEEDNMEFLKQVIAKMGLTENATKEEVLTAIAALKEKPPETKEIVAKDVIAALGLKESDDTSVVVASIHALKQSGKGVVSKAEFDELQKKLQKKDADEVVAKALAVGKITPDQKEWAFEYAQRDIKGFEVFVTKAPVVVPVGNLPGKKEEAAQASIDDATKTVAKMMDVSAEDIKKYGG